MTFIAYTVLIVFVFAFVLYVLCGNVWHCISTILPTSFWENYYKWDCRFCKYCKKYI